MRNACVGRLIWVCEANSKLRFGDESLFAPHTRSY
jgi:hypothetical protein